MKVIFYNEITYIFLLMNGDFVWVYRTIYWGIWREYMTEDNEIQELRERLIKVETKIDMLMNQQPVTARSFIKDFSVGFVVVLGSILLISIISLVVKQIFFR
jgi:tetrahydromethanopterin S-methyltransferase subunit G